MNFAGYPEIARPRTGPFAAAEVWKPGSGPWRFQASDSESGGVDVDSGLWCSCLKSWTAESMENGHRHLWNCLHGLKRPAL